MDSFIEAWIMDINACNSLGLGKVCHSMIGSCSRKGAFLPPEHFSPSNVAGNDTKKESGKPFLTYRPVNIEIAATD